MAVRIVDSRMPAGFQPSDLGEAVTTEDGRCTLISFQTSPISACHENTYVLFVTDSTLAGSVKSYDWFIVADGAAPVTLQSDVGEITHQPNNIGNICVTVRLLDATQAMLKTVQIVQQVGAVNPALEQLIADAESSPGPGASNEDAIREMVNEYYGYYQSIVPQPPEPDDAFKSFVCGLIFDAILKKTRDERAALLDRLFDSIENGGTDLSIIADQGVGTGAIRLALLAMIFPAASPLLNWVEMPQAASENAVADEDLRQKLDSLSEDDKIDLINLTRFPKTNIAFTARLAEALRDRYFPATSFHDVVTGLSGTRAHWITEHYNRGPLVT
jgi:hypothetical protein